MTGLAVIFGIQIVVIGIMTWLLSRRYESQVRKAISGVNKEQLPSDVTGAADVLAGAQNSLADHAEQCQRFERALHSAKHEEGAHHQDAGMATVARMRQANHSVEHAVDDAIADLIATCGEALTTERSSLESYKDKTQTFDLTLAGIKHEELLVEIASNLLATVRELRAESQSVQDELSASKDEIVKLLKRASSAEQAARVDTLTQLLNRRAFDEAYRQCQLQQEQDGRSFSMVLLDIDHFKAVNDQYGHAAGDAVLSLVARILRENCNTSDLTSRLGGEEFGVLLPGCKERSAVRVAERYRRAIASAVLRYENREISITVSCGVAQATLNRPQSDLLKRADAALYLAKKQGRNQVCSDTQVIEESQHAKRIDGQVASPTS